MIDPKEVKKQLKYDKPLVLSIDFDRTIHDIDNPIQGKRMGAPMPNAKKIITQLYNRGFIIHVFTLRARTPEGSQTVGEWMEYYSIPYHEITATKPDAAIYIDDKAMYFQEWNNELVDRIFDRLEIPHDDA